MTLKVAIFDDVLFARREIWNIPGLDIVVYADADDVRSVCITDPKPDVLCMDFAMGPDHMTGAEAVRAARETGFAGRIVAMSSDPSANARMIAAGADVDLVKKAMLRPFLLDLGRRHLTGS